jgi:hypothetical protein
MRIGIKDLPPRIYGVLLINGRAPRHKTLSKKTLSMRGKSTFEEAH